MSASNKDVGRVNMEITHGIATIEFQHPASNSLPRALLQELAETITAAGKDEGAKVIVLKSGGDRAFCAGASFDELVAIENLDEGKRFFMGFAQVINAIRRAPKFVIGRVQGKAVGGGVGLASAVDYCLATTHSAIKLSELAIGIGPFVVGPAVERKVGKSGLSALAIAATEWKSAEWAHDHGLYSEIHDDVDSLDGAVSALAEKLSQSNPAAMAELKKIFWTGTENWDTLLDERAAISGELVLSDFTRNAIARFKQGAR